MRNQGMRNQRGRRTEKKEFQEKTLEIRRVTRVVAGGKRFSFRAAVVVGDLKGRVGFGVAKGLDVVQSIQKAVLKAKKEMISVPLKEDRTLFYDVEGKYGAARVRLKPARPNHGLIAGGPVRVVLELAGVRDVSAKILGGTTSKINNARATLKALKKIKQHAKPQSEKSE
jgi:small subunit ribosomal protein S5